ncbi:MAG: NfeD family protein [Planctomycetota bacterium]|nr:NfeD family protein [Planctomycetota bacterium]
MQRRPSFLALLALLALACAAATPAAAEDAPPARYEKIRVIDFEGDIEALVHAYVKRRVEAAVEEGVDCIVLRVDSFGGTVLHSKMIGDLLLEVPARVHTVAWIPTKAISGAAMISLACREIVMAPTASIGDSQPITEGAGGKPEPVGEKYESPLRTWFRTYAERNGYPIALVEAMVSASIDVLEVRPKGGSTERFYIRGADYREAEDDAELVPGHRKVNLEQVGPAVVRKGELLTLTTAEALRHGFVQRRFDGGPPSGEEALLAVLKAPGAEVSYTAMTFSEKASKWLLKLAGILSALVALAVLLFVWQGPGLMTIIGGVALLLVLMINATAEQLHGFPIFLMLLGVALLAAEVFLLPGFTIPGFLGIASLVFGLLLLATGRTPDNLGELDTGVMLGFGLQFVATVIIGAVALVVLGRFVPRFGPARRMILTAGGNETPVAAPRAEAALPGLGATGTARSPLRPAGSADFAGTLVDVVSVGTYIEAGRTVRVVAVEGATVSVEEASA